MQTKPTIDQFNGQDKFYINTKMVVKDHFVVIFKLLKIAFLMPFKAYYRYVLKEIIQRIRRPRNLSDMLLRAGLRLYFLVYLFLFFLLLPMTYSNLWTYNTLLRYYAILPSPFYLYFRRKFLLTYIVLIFLTITNILGVLQTWS